MPELNGLETAKIIKQQLNQVEILFLTANSKFEYAQEAIKIGVIDFLVKPYSNKTFKNSLAKTLKKIENYKKEKLEINSLQKNINNIHEILEKDIINMLLKNENNSKNIESFLKVLNINSNSYFSLIIKNFSKNEVEDIKKIIVQSFSNASENIISSYFLNRIIFYIFFDEKNSEIIKNIFIKLKNGFIKSNKNYYIERSNNYKESKNIKKCYQEVKLKISNIIKNQNNPQILLSYELEDKIYKEILNCNSSKAIEYFYKLEKFLIKNSNNSSKIKNFFYEMTLLTNKLISQTTKIDFSEKNEEMYDLIFNFSDYKNIKKQMEKFIIESINLIKEYKDEKEICFIKLSKKYIEMNYNKNISLKEISKYLGMSSFYFSKCFKKELGINFKDYIIDVKINKAKFFLSNEELNIAEIAYKLGYNDPNYFSACFKKKVGLSPKQYKILNK